MVSSERSLGDWGGVEGEIWDSGVKKDRSGDEDRIGVWSEMMEVSEGAEHNAQC